MPLPTHTVLVTVSWFVPASRLDFLLLLLPSTIYSQLGYPPQAPVRSCPSSCSALTIGFHLPQRKVQDFPWYARPYGILPVATFSDLIFYYFSPHSVPPTLTSMLSLAHAQVLPRLRLLPGIFFPPPHGSFFPSAFLLKPPLESRSFLTVLSKITMPFLHVATLCLLLACFPSIAATTVKHA